MWRALRTMSCSICCLDSLAVVRNEKMVTANISPPSSSSSLSSAASIEPGLGVTRARQLKSAPVRLKEKPRPFGNPGLGKLCRRSQG
jgi:hypothetical protein